MSDEEIKTQETVREELPWNADWELEMTEECGGAVEGGRGAVRDRGTGPEEVGTTFIGELLTVEEEVGGGRDDGGKDKEGPSTGPCIKSLNSSSSSAIVGGSD